MQSLLNDMRDNILCDGPESIERILEGWEWLHVPKQSGINTKFKYLDAGRFVCLYIDTGVCFWLFCTCFRVHLHLFNASMNVRPHHDGNSNAAHTIIHLQLWVEAGAAQSMCMCQLSAHLFWLVSLYLFIFFFPILNPRVIFLLPERENALQLSVVCTWEQACPLGRRGSSCSWAQPEAWARQSGCSSVFIS